MVIPVLNTAEGVAPFHILHYAPFNDYSVLQEFPWTGQLFNQAKAQIMEVLFYLLTLWVAVISLQRHYWSAQKSS